MLKEVLLTVSLTPVYDKPRTRRAKAAISFLKSYAKKHTRKQKIVIADSLNTHIWKTSIGKPPRKIRLKIKIMKEKALVELAEGAIKSKVAEKKQ